MKKVTVKYSDILKRFEQSKQELSIISELAERINNGSTFRSQEYDNVVKFVLGKNVNGNDVSFETLWKILNDVSKAIGMKFEGYMEVNKIRNMVSRVKINVLWAKSMGSNPYDIASDGIELEGIDDVSELDKETLIEKLSSLDGDVNDIKSDLTKNNVGYVVHEQQDKDATAKEQNIDFTVSYDDFIENIKYSSSPLNFRENFIEEIINDLQNNKIADEDVVYRVVSTLFDKKINEGNNSVYEISGNIAPHDLAEFFLKVKKDFEKNKIAKNNELAEKNKAGGTDEEIGCLNADIKFFEKWCEYLDYMHEYLKKCEFKNTENKGTKINLKYVSSGVKNKFRFKNLEPKKFLGAIKKYGKYAVIGTGVGMAASVVVPSVAISGVGTIRLAYSAGKFVNKVISKGFLGGKPTKVDKIITSAKEKIKNIEITKRSIDEETKEEITKKVNFKDTKFYKKIQAFNNKLKNPKVQWFINGMAIGYKLGNWLDLDGKVKSLFENKQPTTTTVPNETINLQTEATEPTINGSTVPQETIPSQDTVRPIRKPRPEIQIDAPTSTQTTDYSWLDVGKDGDKIDLSGMKQGYTDSYAARGAYTGQYEHLNKAVKIVSEYASLDNGTFISEIRLPDGKIFTGNVGELLKKGIDPAKCAANICNTNGEFAWQNLEEVLENLSNKTTKSR